MALCCLFFRLLFGLYIEQSAEVINVWLETRMFKFYPSGCFLVLFKLFVEVPTVANMN